MRWPNRTQLLWQDFARQQEQQPRWKRVLNELNGQMGEALGQVYVARTFPMQAKAQARTGQSPECGAESPHEQLD